MYCIYIYIYIYISADPTSPFPTNARGKILEVQGADLVGLSRPISLFDIYIYIYIYLLLSLLLLLYIFLVLLV